MSDQEWVVVAVAAMLERVRAVVIWELEQMAKEMRRG